MFNCRILRFLVGIAALAHGDPVDRSSLSKQTINANSSNGRWIPSWASMPQLTEPANLPPTPFNQTGAVFVNSTIRQTVHTSIGSSHIRLRISNAFGVTSLPVTAVTVALTANNTAGVPEIKADTLQNVTFSGSPSISIPNGALAVSDPLNFHAPPQTMVTVTIYLQNGQRTNSITSHPGSRTTSWWQHGNAVSAQSLDITDSTIQSAAHWYFISSIEVWVPSTYGSLVIMGDSITDGRGSDTNKNNRWPDLLFARLQKNDSTTSIGVINQGAGGNRVLADGLGPSALSRIERDILAHPGVKYALIFEGVNDIGTAPATAVAQDAVYTSLIQAFSQMATRIHGFQIPVFGATITPFSAPANFTGQPYSNPEYEKTRTRVNTWIKESGVFDAVLDFDAILRDPAEPTMLAPEVNSGDYLHPNPMGYQMLADAFDIGVFAQYADGVVGFM